MASGIAPLSPLVRSGPGRNAPYMPLVPTAPSDAQTFNPSAANNLAAKSKNDLATYSNDAFNKWYGDLHPDAAEQFRPVTPPAGKLYSRNTNAAGNATTTIDNSTPDDIAAQTRQAQLAAARAHFTANVLPNDQRYQALNAQNTLTGNYRTSRGLTPLAPMETPLEPRVQAAQIAGDARTKAAQITADQKPGMGERLITGLGSGLKGIAETGIKAQVEQNKINSQEKIAGDKLTAAGDKDAAKAQGTNDDKSYKVARDAANKKVQDAQRNLSSVTGNKRATPEEKAAAQKILTDALGEYYKMSEGRLNQLNPPATQPHLSPDQAAKIAQSQPSGTGVSVNAQTGQAAPKSLDQGPPLNFSMRALPTNEQARLRPATGATGVSSQAARDVGVDDLTRRVGPSIPPEAIPHTPGTKYEDGRIGFDKDGKQIRFNAATGAWESLDGARQ